MSKHLWRKFLFLLAQMRTLSDLLPMSSLALRFLSWVLRVSGLPTSAQSSFLARSSPESGPAPCTFFFTSAIFCLCRHPHASSVGPPVQISIQVWKVNHPIRSLDALLIFFKHLQQGTSWPTGKLHLIYLYVCMYIYIYTYIHTYLYICTVYIYTYIHMIK